MFVEKSEINFYAWYVYQKLCGKNGYFKSADNKANVCKDERFDETDKAYFNHFSRKNFLHPNSLKFMEGDKLKKFYSEIGKYYREKSATLKRLQFNTVAILKRLEKQGFKVIDVINYWRDDVVYRKRFQILLRKGNVFLLLEDDFTDKGSTLKLYAGVWTPILLSAQRHECLELIYDIPHRRKNENKYLDLIAVAVGVCFKTIK